MRSLVPPVMALILGSRPMIAYGGPTTQPTSSVWMSPNHLLAQPPNMMRRDPFESYAICVSERGSGGSPLISGRPKWFEPVSSTPTSLRYVPCAADPLVPPNTKIFQCGIASTLHALWFQRGSPKLVSHWLHCDSSVS